MNPAPTPNQGQLHQLSDDLSVRRLLPALSARRVGSLVFFDQIGPADFSPGSGMHMAAPGSATTSTRRTARPPSGHPLFFMGDWVMYWQVLRGKVWW